ncbi:hypothetical protein ACFYRG_50835 [Streptomyces mirabilis]|uniref:hypothetical protein n=1 Tax=Streptomyces mirabilis TaxID=68239 RepID=UPI0036B76890
MVRGVGEGVGEGFPLAVSAPPPHCIDSTIVRAHQHATDTDRRRRDPQASAGKLKQPVVNVVGETAALRATWWQYLREQADAGTNVTRSAYTPSPRGCGPHPFSPH